LAKPLAAGLRRSADENLPSQRKEVVEKRGLALSDKESKTSQTVQPAPCPLLSMGPFFDGPSDGPPPLFQHAFYLEEPTPAHDIPRHPKQTPDLPNPPQKSPAILGHPSLVTAVVDNTGAVKERYAYTPYGEATVLNPSLLPVAGNTSTISSELLYTGRRTDPETGLQLNRNRFYHSKLGRWVNRDPIEYLGGYNLYDYVFGNPIRNIDPSGTVAKKTCLWSGRGEEGHVVKIIIAMKVASDCTTKEPENCKEPKCSDRCSGKAWPVLIFKAFHEGSSKEEFEAGASRTFKSCGVSKVLGSSDNGVFRAEIDCKGKAEVDCCGGSMSGLAGFFPRGRKDPQLKFIWSFEVSECGNVVRESIDVELGRSDHNEHRIKCY